MELERLFTWICFFFCLGLAATGVLVFFKEKSRRSFTPFLLLQYFLILIYTYGFYAIWSGIFYRQIFVVKDSSLHTSPVPSYLMVIGMPFLLISFVILVLWAIKFSKGKVPGMFFSGGIVASFLIIITGYFFQDFNWRLDIQGLYALLFMIVILLTCLFLSVYQVQYLNFKRKYLLMATLFLTGAIHLPVFLFPSVPFLAPFYAFLFFLTNTVFGLYFVYSIKPHIPKEEAEPLVTFETFFNKFGITSRESEIILEIYSGKTNKEIAESLFVTVQTIKDHTHRIYQKTNMKNRTQLVSELRKFQ